MIRRFILLVTFLIATPAVAYVASSANYRLQSDSVNFSGTTSASTNFNLQDSVGEFNSGTSTSATYSLNAGYQAMLLSSISISVPSDVSLSNIPGNIGGTSSGSVAWTVTTDDPSGYALYVKASTNPALQSSGSSFANYAPSGAVPDYQWSVAAATSAFGFSPEGTNVVSRYLDNGSVCGTGASNATDQCWDGFSTSNRQVAGATSGNQPSGTATTVKLRAEAGATAGQADGSYSAVITATATAL